MSVFRTTPIGCPGCGAAIAFELVHSVNADRRPDLRESVLDGSFQRQTCAGCGLESRVEPEFNYMNQGRGQWIGAWPGSALKDWEARAAQAREAFDEGFGPNSPPGARELGLAMKCRVTFGWAALREKLLIAAEGLDDVTVEIAKLALIRDSRMPPLATAALRLLAVQDGKLFFGWQDDGTEQVTEYLNVSRTLIDELEADEDWQPQREQLAASPFVDVQRLFMATAAA
ncbi:CpXC domain-containing protein [Pelomonas sp. KK5]|uniref:CpXC domain-containing protein n=1 Tax=Pelomonas sp. KK5 TaxID=1855730 RepID=UPI00097BFE92|nr:CpXC domain-containing protein [Pelomonas sp. KK5]